MAVGDYKLEITDFNWRDDTHKQMDLEFSWPGLADGASEYGFTDRFEIYVRYHIVNNKGERKINREDPSTTITAIPGETQYRYYWDIPDECVEVEMKVRAYAKTYTSNGNEFSHWNFPYIETTSNLFYTGDAHKPDKAETPTVTQDPRLGNQVLLELENIRTEDGNNKHITKVEYQVLSVQSDHDDGTILAGNHEALVSDFNTCRYKVDIGNEYGYRFRARYWASQPGEFDKIVGDKWAAGASPVVVISGEWSDLTDIVYGVPNSPILVQDKSIKKQNSTQMLMTLETTGHAHHYQIQIATTTSAFSRMDEWEMSHPDLIENQAARQNALIQTPPVNTEITTENDDTSILIDNPQNANGVLCFRVRSVSAESGGFYSAWSTVITFKFTEPLRAPIVWMNKSFANVGDNSITLNIMHNSPTGSAPTGAYILYKINSGGPWIPYPPRSQGDGIIPPPANSNTFQVAFPLTSYTEECAIAWQARTCEYGEASTPGAERTWSAGSEILWFWIYEKALLKLSFPDIREVDWIPVLTEDDNGSAPIVSSFPFHFRVEPVLSGDQKITSYFIRVIACDSYKEFDGYGNKTIINKGQVLYSTYDNEAPGTIDKYLTVTDVTLANGQIYELNVVAYINTGATVSASAKFTVDLPSADYTIETGLSQNRESVSMGINPMAVIYTIAAGASGNLPLYPYVPDYQDAMIWFETYEKLDKWANDIGTSSSRYIQDIYHGVLGLKMSTTPDRSPIAPEPIYGTEANDYMIYFQTDEEYEAFVASIGMSVEEFTYNLNHGVLCLDYATQQELANNILLSVYRKNQDGTMVEIASNLPNDTGVYVTDPHPHLRDNVYRIVGRDVNTGALAFVDTAPFNMECTDIVIQWDEDYHFDISSVQNDLPSQYMGNMVRLPYNIDVSESASIDNNLVEYIGRKDPVSYYGTQTGYTATWNTVIPKYDKETIAMLRKLQVYAGDCYVREPSGTGYWANVKVTFPINHVELTVSVSLTITRVEGGV